MATDKKGKLTYEMKSPGEAWMDHVNNDLNAKAVTPSYLKPQEKGSTVKAIEQKMAELEKDRSGQAQDRQPEKAKDKNKEIELSR